MSEAILKLSNLRKRYPGGFELSIESLLFRHGELCAIAGENGAGKTTLLRLLSGLLEPDEGIVEFNGHKVRPGRRGLAARRNMVYLTQKPVLFSGTVMQNVLYGLRLRKVPRPNALQKAAAALAAVGLEGFEERSVKGLSGGEAQRVALARAVCIEPLCLLLDEPVAHLDRVHKNAIKACMRALSSEGNTLVIFTTHHVSCANPLASRVVHLERGRVVEETEGS